MAEADIRAAIVSLLNTITDIGEVHDYECHSADWKTFLDQFKTTIGDHSEIRGWEVFRSGPLTEDSDQLAVHTYRIRGYMGVAAAGVSGKTFDILVESIRTLFRQQANAKLNSTCTGAKFLQIPTLEVRSFGGVLCHFMEGTLTVYEETTV